MKKHVKQVNGHKFIYYCKPGSQKYTNGKYLTNWTVTDCATGCRAHFNSLEEVYRVMNEILFWRTYSKSRKNYQLQMFCKNLSV